MVNTQETRKRDIKKVIRSLDITPSMFKNAEEKYKNMARFLNEHGLNVDISLQGSFAIGTATKPYADGKDRAYDIDVICLFKEKESTPKVIRDNLVSMLSNSEVYNDKLIEWPKCFTLEYARLGDYDFSMDLVPTVEDNNSNIGSKDISLEYLTNVLKIATKEDKYDWYPINPKGYQKWFNNINERFALYNKEYRMRQLLEENKNFYSSVEEIPEYFNKSSLQEAIQLLKRSRDIYFSKIHKEKNKPSSIIITTFATLVAKDLPTNIDSVDLAFEVVKRLSLYSTDKLYSQISTPIIKRSGTWEFFNPVNSTDNLLDSWNVEHDSSKLFFEWVEKAKKDFNKLIDINSTDHIDILGNSFGNEIVDKLFKRTKTETITTGAKPYHE